ncbi:succinate dehydrogenase cytochrome b560 subunit, mitochondrial [Agrilus planipennis]|uniref:Succinate dehydrogenase cytochrome b560 subunit, mitochondrial n=1 Tax=Agrilus planipennis TaxID=224129 RepID=A0A1W4WTS6_AGRPL|nr:succinate dehydrogenase cytochrome b560 subunit, mitochondrial [Agrilus planipennis]
MLSVYRLVNRSCNKISLANNFQKNVIISARAVTMKIVPEPPSSDQDFFEKNEQLKRPQSPHLTIYKPQITSMLSITHRITGMVLAGYVTAFGIGVLILPHDWPHYISALETVSPATLFLGKLLVAFPFSYHFWNGIRHLVWDIGQLFKLKEVYTTGYIVLGTTAVTTVILSLL